MQVIGIDFGTTNIRISIWDSDKPDQIPQPLTIGQGDAYTMPTVIAFRRQPGGKIDTIVGENADGLEDGPNQVIVRNVKRYALADDSYVLWHLEVRETEWPSWWNQESRCVRVWDQEFPVKDLLFLMLKEAFQRAGLTSGFEWRAGCPVHAGLSYRSDLTQVITELGGTGRGEVSRIVEEPLLLLALAHEMGTLNAGSYMVYDLGGGSFDCALAQIDDNKEMIIYGADGNPTIGGSDIDEFLINDLQYAGPTNLLRLAKETISPSNPAQNLPGGQTITWQDYQKAVKEYHFIPKTFSAMRDTYIGAKVIWSRYIDGPPMGEVIGLQDNAGYVKFVWQLGWKDMTADLDGIILCGGPTKSPVFLDNLKAQFGETQIIPTAELIPSEIPDPELTAISAGACYIARRGYSPLYVNRLPVQITLEDMQTGEKVHYEPYEHLLTSPKHLFDGFVSKNLLAEHTEDLFSDKRYELTVTTPDGVLLPIAGLDGIERERHQVDPYIDTRLIGSSLRLVIDRLGRVGVEQQSRNTEHQKFLVLEDNPWQTGVPKQARERVFAEDREFRKVYPYSDSNWREGLKTPGGRAP